jgi:hypothetical protein
MTRTTGHQIFQGSLGGWMTCTWTPQVAGVVAEIAITKKNPARLAAARSSSLIASSARRCASARPDFVRIASQTMSVRFPSANGYTSFFTPL